MVTYEFTQQESTASLMYLVKAIENNAVVAEFSICVNTEDEKESVAADGLYHIQNSVKDY
jgi:hypothetical protein